MKAFVSPQPWFSNSLIRFPPTCLTLTRARRRPRLNPLNSRKRHGRWMPTCLPCAADSSLRPWDLKSPLSRSKPVWLRSALSSTCFSSRHPKFLKLLILALKVRSASQPLRWALKCRFPGQTLHPPTGGGWAQNLRVKQALCMMLGPSLPPKTPLSSVPGHELGDSGHSEAIRGERKGEASLPETCPRAWIGAHTWPSLCHTHPWDKLRRQKECRSHGVISKSSGESDEQGTKGGGDSAEPGPKHRWARKKPPSTSSQGPWDTRDHRHCQETHAVWAGKSCLPRKCGWGRGVPALKLVRSDCSLPPPHPTLPLWVVGWAQGKCPSVTASSLAFPRNKERSPMGCPTGGRGQAKAWWPFRAAACPNVPAWVKQSWFRSGAWQASLDPLVPEPAFLCFGWKWLCAPCLPNNCKAHTNVLVTNWFSYGHKAKLLIPQLSLKLRRGCCGKGSSLSTTSGSTKWT